MYHELDKSIKEEIIVLSHLKENQFKNPDFFMMNFLKEKKIKKKKKE